MRVFNFRKDAFDYSRNPQKETFKLKEAEYRKLIEIAKRDYTIKDRGDLEARMNDGEDFLDISVWELEEMLVRAYEAGKAAR